MHCQIALVFSACLILFTQSASVMPGKSIIGGGGGGGGGGCGAIITPLTGCSLSTTRGTVTFANTQGPYGYNVLLNGASNGIQATALKVTGGFLIAKYDTAMPAVGVQTACMQETTEINNISAPMAFFLPTSCPPGM